MIAIVAGLAAGWLAWHFTSGSSGLLGRILPEVYAVIAFGVISPLVLMGTSNLRLAPAETATAAADAASHGGHGHTPAHH